jgi:hypothetical protein
MEPLHLPVVVGEYGAVSRCRTPFSAQIRSSNTGVYGNGTARIADPRSGHNPEHRDPRPSNEFVAPGVTVDPDDNSDDATDLLSEARRR